MTDTQKDASDLVVCPVNLRYNNETDNKSSMGRFCAEEAFCVFYVHITFLYSYLITCSHSYWLRLSAAKDTRYFFTPSSRSKPAELLARARGSSCPASVPRCVCCHEEIEPGRRGVSLSLRSIHLSSSHTARTDLNSQIVRLLKDSRLIRPPSYSDVVVTRCAFNYRQPPPHVFDIEWLQ